MRAWARRWDERVSLLFWVTACVLMIPVVIVVLVFRFSQALRDDTFNDP